MKRFANVSIPSIKKIVHTSFEKQLLKSCSVRLFILLHFYANANTGITTPIELEDLASALDCNIKTIRSNILRLESCGFFDATMDPITEEYTFTIHGYTQMYNPINMGGGYIQCTDELLKQLLQIKSINELRVILMLLCEAITTELQSAAKLAVAKTQEKLNKIGASVDGAKENLSAFDKMEDKINKKLDEANAMAELNSPKNLLYETTS